MNFLPFWFIYTTAVWVLHLTLWYLDKVPRIKDTLQSSPYLLGETGTFSKYLEVHHVRGTLAFSSLDILSQSKPAFYGHRGEGSRPAEWQRIMTIKREAKGAECGATIPWSKNLNTTSCHQAPYTFSKICKEGSLLAVRTILMSLKSYELYITLKEKALCCNQQWQHKEVFPIMSHDPACWTAIAPELSCIETSDPHIHTHIYAGR